MASISTVGVVALGLWLIRIQGARISLLEDRAKSAREDLDDQRKRCADELESARSHNERLRQQHDIAREIFERQLEDEKRKVGIDPSGQITAERIEMPEEVRTNVAEILGLLRQMRLERAHVEITTVPSPEAIAQEHLGQGNTYFAVGDYEKAISEYTRALEMQPDDPVISFNRGLALRHLGRHEEALADYNRSLQLRPDDPDTLNNRGVALGHLGRYEEALADYDRALQLHPDDPTTLNNRGIALVNLGRNDEAIADYDRALEVRPDDANALMNRGVILAHLLRYDDALAGYNRALALHPDHPHTLSNRAVVLGLLDQDEEAIADFDRALAVSPRDPGVYFDRACYYALQGKNDLSLDDLKRAIAGDRRFLHEARADSFLDNIRSDPRFRELVGEDEPLAESGPPA